jgi:hypothetical protein
MGSKSEMDALINAEILKYQKNKEYLSPIATGNRAEMFK